MLANRITTLEQYAKVARPGRGVRLSRPQRIAVWKLVDAFRRQSQMDETISFPEVLALAAEALVIRAEADGTLPRRSRHRRRGARSARDPLGAVARVGVRRAQRSVHRGGLASADLRQPNRAEPLRNQDRRSVPAADAELPNDRAESALRGQRAVRSGVHAIWSKAKRRPATTGRRATGPSPN